mmetsp:Transcript_25094/g.46910  ORF Transcript_25094/g.46910 Transcript_25094/m.46910 type:complete len:215 (-) Transcript_25094:49-693(-)
MVRQSLEAGSQDLLRGHSGSLNTEITVHEHLRLDNGNKTIHLADGGVSGEGLGVLINGNHRRSGSEGVLNVKHSAPLGKASTLGIVLGASGIKVIHTLSHTLAVSAEQRLDALVHLDTRNDTLGLKDINKLSAIIGILVQSLLVQNNTGNVFLQVLRLEQKLTVLATVVLVVLHGDGIEALANSSGGLVSSENSLARGRDSVSSGDEFSSVLHV